MMALSLQVECTSLKESYELLMSISSRPLVSPHHEYMHHCLWLSILAYSLLFEYGNGWIDALPYQTPCLLEHINIDISYDMSLHEICECMIGCMFKFWVADWFAQLNNKMDGDLKKIRMIGQYMIGNDSSIDR